MATKIELEIRIRELERRLENDEQDMVEVCDRIERLESERDEYRRSSNDWARHFKSERTARINAEAEVARLREEMGKCVRMAKNAGYGPARTMADKLLKALAEGNDNG